MKVFFTGAKKGKKELQNYYDQIVKSVRKNKGEVIGLEVNKYEDLIDKRVASMLSPEELHYLFIKTGIDKANAVIVESTFENFQLGHEATIALLFNKPVLCLSREGGINVKIFDPRLKFYHYTTEKDVDKIISVFLNEVKNKYLSVRLHVNLSPEHKNFLDWYGSKKSKNISQIIRDSIQSMMMEHPEFYEIDSRFSQK